MVSGTYSLGKFIPRKFLWSGKTYPIEEITLTTDIKDGGTKQRMYSVLSAGNVYRLMFNRDLETWILSEVWYE